VLYTLSVADVTMLVALGFVLARNIIKLVVERRRGLPFARFLLKLLAALLGLTIVPSVLVLLAGTEMIRQTTARWFSQPVTDVLTSANAIASTFYRDREAAVAAQATALVSSGPPVRVSIASDFLPGDLARAARQMTEAYEGYTQLRVLKGPLEGVYLSLFVMMTLMILVSATWLASYLAKRITRPVGMLAAGAREIGAGHLDHRIEAETRDEFGSLVEAFNSMAGELATSQRRLERTRVEVERKNSELDERRRYIETVLERIATGVVSIGPDGRVSTINAAAARLLEVDAGIVGSPVE